jgi:cell cycle arrest protein BUB2
MQINIVSWWRSAPSLPAIFTCLSLQLGPCSDDKKIRDDTFRTYKNNATFWSRVDESKLSRVLTVCSRTYSQHSSPAAASRAIYVQGMNVLVAPFLFLMPEVDAYTAFMALISRHCPRYVVSNLDGVHHGCSLVDRTLEILDPVLHRHIIDKKLRPEIFAFPFTMTLLANMSPLSEVIRLWDAIFAFGIHFDILLVTCHLMLMREDLLAEQQAYQSLLPPPLSFLNSLPAGSRR